MSNSGFSWKSTSANGNSRLGSSDPARPQRVSPSHHAASVFFPWEVVTLPFSTGFQLLSVDLYPQIGLEICQLKTAASLKWSPQRITITRVSNQWTVLSQQLKFLKIDWSNPSHQTLISLWTAACPTPVTVNWRAILVDRKLFIFRAKLSAPPPVIPNYGLLIINYKP